MQESELEAEEEGGLTMEASQQWSKRATERTVKQAASESSRL